MDTIDYIFKTYGFAFGTLSGLLFSSIGYFISRYFNIKDKKNELKHSLFQQSKVEAINNFIDCYTNCELSIVQAPYPNFLKGRISNDDYDGLVIPIYNKLASSHFKLLILLDQSEMVEFTEIYECMGNLRMMLFHLKMSVNEETIGNQITRYGSEITDVSRANRERIKIIGEKFREKYS